VTFSTTASVALRSHLEKQLGEIDRIDRAGSLWQEHGLVFATESGPPSTATT
jgi:hypothetical protein